MTTQETKVDWSRPIEAVHEDGRVVAIGGMPSADRGYIISPELEGGWFHFRASGDHVYSGCPWRIRNVDEDDLTDPTIRAFHGLPPQAPTPSPDLTARMVANTKAIAEYGGTMANLAEARAIAAELEQVDGDLIEAQLIVDGRGINPDDPEYHAAVGIADEAIKRGRALERGEAK